jgi:Fe-S-cluster containining protein
VVVDLYKELSLEIESIYRESADAFSGFQKSSSLTCLPGCGSCCLNPEVMATPLEMLPMALEFIRNNNASEILDKMAALNDNAACALYVRESEDGQRGKCGMYEWRPCICRSFGAGARKGKTGVRELSVCKKIKEANPEHWKLAQENTGEAPLIGEFASRIRSLHPGLTRELLPINDALKAMLEKLLMAFAYDLQDLKDSE